MLQFHLACVAVKPMGPRAMIYSAAAVSDFYIPYHQMGEHKIQSAAGDPHIPLTNTPKMLYMVTHEWAPEAYTVSFKLETDTAILLQKASSAIVRYNVDCVVANILMTRYQEIRLVFNKKSAKNEKMSYSGAEQNDQAAVELIVKKDDHPLESQFGSSSSIDGGMMKTEQASAPKMRLRLIPPSTSTSNRMVCPFPQMRSSSLRSVP